MAEIITVPNVKLSFAQYSWLSLRFTSVAQPKLMILLIPFGCGILLVGAILIGRVSLVEAWRSDNSFPVIFGLFFFFYIPISIWYGFKKQYTINKYLKNACSYKFTNYGLVVDTPDSHTELAWPAFLAAWCFGPWMILTTAQNAGFFIDTRQTVMPATAETVYEFLQEKQIEFK